MPNIYSCPTTKRTDDDLVGCGYIFNGEPDHEGLVDCPRCGLWWRASSIAVQDLQARDLMPGDLLLGSRRTVEAVRHGGLDIPTGKVRVKLIGEAHSRLWGRSTTMRIARVSD